MRGYWDGGTDDCFRGNRAAGNTDGWRASRKLLESAEPVAGLADGSSAKVQYSKGDGQCG